MQRNAQGGLQRERLGDGDFLPSPDMLAQYETIMPGSAERMLRLVEDHTIHRYEMEQAQLAADTRKAYVALGVGGGIAGFGLLVGAGIAFGASAFGSIVANVLGQRRQQPAPPTHRIEAPRQLAAFDL